MSRTMKNPEKVPFIGMLETFLDRRLLSPEQDALDAAYEDYVDMLHSLTARSLRPPLDLLHDLARLQSRLMRSQARIVEKESPQASLLESALLLTNFEIRLVFTRLRYPSIADPVSVEVPKSPLYLSKGNFTTVSALSLNRKKLPQNSFLRTLHRTPEPFRSYNDSKRFWGSIFCTISLYRLLSHFLFYRSFFSTTFCTS